MRRSGWTDAAAFVREFVRDPLRTAAPAPSSAALATAMTRALPVGPRPGGREPVVVELGPGTGPFTAAIQARLGGRGRHVAVELNPAWARLLARRHPTVELVVDDARRLPEILAERDVAAVDAVVSGLPWVAHATGPDGRPGVLETAAAVLAPDGVLTQFGYTWTRWAPPARRLVADLHRHFDEVGTSRTVWRNLPPAVVHTARRPRRPPPSGGPGGG